MSTELQTTRFDYNALERDKARGLRQQATAIKAAIKRTQNDIIEIGNRLRDVRNELTDQSFSAWIDHEFSMSRQSAYNFISVFDSFGSCKTVLQLPFHQSALYALASPSVTQGTRDFAIEYASTGETVTKAVAKEIIAAHRPPVAPKITPEPEIEAVKVDDEGDYFDDF